MSLLSARDVSRTYRRASFPGAGKPVPVLDAVSLAIAPGEAVGLVGRSGCGKSTLARLLTGLERPDAGEVFFRDRPLGAFGAGDWRDLRRAVQMVFQDPVGAVNPRLSVGEIIAEPLRHLCNLDGEASRARVAGLLRAVELDPGDAEKRPPQLSGGQLQRVCIARALAPRPRLIILDEAVSSLDLPLQIGMLDLFERLRRDSGIACLLITHDLRLVERFCARALVMAGGRIVEEAAVSRPLALASPEGRALRAAVLPAFPA